MLPSQGVGLSPSGRVGVAPGSAEPAIAAVRWERGLRKVTVGKKERPVADLRCLLRARTIDARNALLCFVRLRAVQPAVLGGLPEDVLFRLSPFSELSVRWWVAE